MFNAGGDVVSDMGKLRRAGFVEPTDTEGWFSEAFDRLRERKVIP